MTCPRTAVSTRMVSVGINRARGHANLAQYCKTLFGLVREGGLVMNRSILLSNIRMPILPVGRGAGDFIERYVFPNGELPHLAMMTAEISEAGLEVVDVESLRLHYARTLDHWSERLEDNLEAAAEDGAGASVAYLAVVPGGARMPRARAGSTCTRSSR